eukprot:TRINITY_DN1971_c13_g1_i1.p1 TRINITY_DN1971_c13_g1~~TRINITY_DN1971_c13_g1_i1.p1  ORF type:complete len:106 (+),score=9.69 TRINITY_DN1971_c13_g1_i1:211-528(+)
MLAETNTMSPSLDHYPIPLTDADAPTTEVHHLQHIRNNQAEAQKTPRYDHNDTSTSVGIDSSQVLPPIASLLTISSTINSPFDVLGRAPCRDRFYTVLQPCALPI